MKTRRMSWCALMAVLGIAFGADCVLPRLAAQKKDDDAADSAAAILRRLRKACEDEPALRGTLLVNGKKSAPKKALILEGFLDNEDQRTSLAKRANAEIAAFAPWKEQYPGGAVLEGLKISPVRSQYLARIKKDFANLIVPRDVDEKEARTVHRLMSQTRLDDVYYHHTGKDWQLMLEGVCLFVDPEKKADGTRERLARVISQLLTKEFPPPEWKGLDIAVSPARIQVVNPLPAFQAKFTGPLAATDVLFHDARYAEDGTLLLKGWIGGPDAAAKRQQFEKHFAEHPAVAFGKPRFSFEGMKALDWPLDRKKWNRVLGQDPTPELSKTHLVRIYFDLSDPGRPVLRCDAVMFADTRPDQEDKIKQRAEELLSEIWKKDWPETMQMFEGRLAFHPVSRRKIQKDLQRTIVSELGIKQGLISKILYDADGVLIVEGSLASNEQRRALVKYLESSEWYRWSNGRLSVDGLVVEDWDAKMKSFQAALAGHPSLLFRQTRLDEVSFVFPDADSKLKMRFHGITFHEPPDDKQANALEEVLEKVAEQWPILRDKAISIRDIKTIPSADKELQERIKETPTLDGVFLAGPPIFDRDGKLVLPGKWRGPEQVKDLTRFIEAHYQKRASNPAAKGLVFDQLESVPTAQLLKDLRDWARTKEDIRIERLYFDSEGKLRIQGAVGAEASVGKVTAELGRLIKLLPDKKHRELKIADKNADAKLKLVSLVAQDGKDGKDGNGLAVRPSLARHLRSKVLISSDSSWDGVLIERGFYDETGAYNIVGLVDDVKQIDRLEAILRELAKTPEWRSHLDRGWSPQQLRAGLTVMPLRPMLAALAALAPDFAELDRLRFERAYHDADNRLCLGGIAIESADLREAAAVLSQQLARHVDWKRRILAVQDGADAGKPPVKLEVKTIPMNRVAAELARNRALALLQDNTPSYANYGGIAAPYYYSCLPVCCLPAVIIVGNEQRIGEIKGNLPPKSIAAKGKELLDVTLFHQPDDTAAWYLRACCYLAMGQEDNALRDLRRMQKIELDNESATKDRLAALEHLQGELRQLAMARSEQALIQVANGYQAADLNVVARAMAVSVGPTR